MARAERFWRFWRSLNCCREMLKFTSVSSEPVAPIFTCMPFPCWLTTAVSADVSCSLQVDVHCRVVMLVGEKKRTSTTSAEASMGHFIFKCPRKPALLTLRSWFHHFVALLLTRACGVLVIQLRALLVARILQESAGGGLCDQRAGRWLD